MGLMLMNQREKNKEILPGWKRVRYHENFCCDDALDGSQWWLENDLDDKESLLAEQLHIEDLQRRGFYEED